jgi:hypothetical protein
VQLGCSYGEGVKGRVHAGLCRDRQDDLRYPRLNVFFHAHQEAYRTFEFSGS